MNAWNNDLGSVRVRSIALPRDGGVLNKATRGRYRCDKTDVGTAIRRERRRLAEEGATPPPAPPAEAVVLSLPPRGVRP